jgi:Calcineurin-like phosphoesterase
VVIGDVGGCSAELAKALVALPDDPETVIIQVGDLVDRGPDSAGVLDIATLLV